MSTKIVGILELASKYKYGFTSRGVPLYLFKPYDEEESDYIVGSSCRETHYNQIALIEVVSKPDPHTKKAKGNLLQLYGRVGDPVAERTALLQHYCPLPKKANKGSEADAEAEEENRHVHLSSETGWITFHIDPVGCRDIDDAIAFYPATGTWAITIADAAAAVPDGSTLDLEAKAAGSTFYSLTGEALRPMLPAAISQGSASLLPGEKRRGLTLFIEPDGTERFGLSWITVKHSFTYESFVDSELAKEVKADQEPHAWIESFMIRYNRAAASVLKQAGLGLLRVQPTSVVDERLAAIDPALTWKGASYEPVSPDKDKIQTHASLGLYCHASSPLRRYADLVNQRIIKQILTARLHTLTLTLNLDIADHLNCRMKAAKRFSRDLTFLHFVTPGKVHEVEVIWITEGLEAKVWVPDWKRTLRLRHEEVHELGYRGRIKIYCDPTRRSWKSRVLTAPL